MISFASRKVGRFLLVAASKNLVARQTLPNSKAQSMKVPHFIICLSLAE